MKDDSKVHSKHTAWNKQNKASINIRSCGFYWNKRSLLEKSTESLQTYSESLIWQGYNLGMSSLIEAILKNQFKQVSLAVSLTLSGEKLSGKKNNPEIVTLFLETSYFSF